MSRVRLAAAPTLLAAAALTFAACSGGGASPSAAAPSASAVASPATSPDASAPASPEGSPSGSPAAETTEVVGVEYAFQGVPETVDAGTTFSFRNGGSEVHEMIVVRRNDDVTKSWDELLQLPEEEAQNYVSILGSALAAPGETAEDTITVEQPGDYLMLCFVPVGLKEMPSDPNASIPAGAPHFTKGMMQEFKVSA